MKVKILNFMDMVKKRFRNRFVAFSIYTIAGVIVLVAVMILWWCVELFLYQPLSKEDFGNLFPEDVKYKKISSRDGLKLTIHGEFFEMHTYKIRNGAIRNDYPIKTDCLGGYKISSDVTLHTWTDSLILSDEYREDIPASKIKRKFEEHWNSVSNYRCCYYISESESYWFVFSPMDNRLYYLVFNP